jgi:hypothetical protein
MQQRTFRPQLMASLLALAAIILMMAPNRAEAQAPCANYVVDIDPNVPTCAFPLTVVTNWGAAPGVNHTTTHAVSGAVGIPRPGGGLWPGGGFNNVTVSGGPPVILGQILVFNNGCVCLRVEVALTPGNCIHIKISAVPPPC